MGPSSEVIFLDPDDLPSFVSVSIQLIYIEIAICCLLAYDTCLTFDKEVKYFWESPQKIVSVIYFINRYVGILGVVFDLLGFLPRANPKLCYHALWTSSLAFSVIMVSIDYLLVVRVLALYSPESVLARFLWTLFVLEGVFSFAFFLYLNVFIDDTIIGATDDASMYYCYALRSFPWFVNLIDWLIPMSYAVLLMALALYKSGRYRKNSAGFSNLTLIKVLIQDQLVYFAFVIACCVSNILLALVDVENAVAGVSLSILANPFLLAVLGSRMSINLKEEGERVENLVTSCKMMATTEPLSDIEFAVFSQSRDNTVHAE